MTGNIEERDFVNNKRLSIVDFRDLSESMYRKKRHINVEQTISNLREKTSEILKNVFLPSGFPNSVPPEYSTFQMWNILQDLCSYLRGVMATKAVLEGLGVGRAGITAVDATVQWVIRDGASMLGGLLFSTYTSANFGQNIKSWRLFADFINNVGITLDMIAPLTQGYFLIVVSIASIAKALCGIAAGATGSVLSEHWGSVQGIWKGKHM